MSSKNQIKIEMAQLAFKGKRYDEAEAALTEVIFSDESDNKEKSNAWSAIGSIKAAKFRLNQATLDEISYCFSKSQQLDNPESDSLYANEVMMILWEYHSTIKALREKLNEIEKNKWVKAITMVINTEIAKSASWNNTYFKIGMLGSSVSSALDYYGDKITAENIPNIIDELKNKASYVLEKYYSVYNFNSDETTKLVEKFLEENNVRFKVVSAGSIYENEIVKRFLDYKNTIGAYFIREGEELDSLLLKPLEKAPLSPGESLLFGVCSNLLAKNCVELIITNKRIFTTLNPSFTKYRPIDKFYYFDQIDNLIVEKKLFSSALVDEKNNIKIPMSLVKTDKEFLETLTKLVLFLKNTTSE
jgi:hypothetical protein